MVTTFLRILKYGFQNFWRNGWLSTATVVVMALALLLFQGLILFDVVTTSAVASIQDKIDIAVYFKRNTAEDDILNIQRSLEQLPEVKTVEYISSERALEKFKETHKDDEIINQAISEVGENPILASLNIKAKDPNDYPMIDTYLKNDTFINHVEKVTYSKNRTAIELLNRIIDTVNKVGLAFTLFIAFTACLVAFNTIRLAIYSNREEIGIMRLVGASNIFTKGPYLVSGILYWIVGAVVAVVLAAPFVNFAAPYFLRLIPEMNLEAYFYSSLGTLFFYLLLFGVFLGIASSWVAIRRYLRI